MDCEETVARLQTYLDRELTGVEIDEVAFHLDKCPPCGNHFRFEAHLKRLIWLRSSKECAPKSLRERIFGRLGEA